MTSKTRQTPEPAAVTAERERCTLIARAAYEAGRPNDALPPSATTFGG